MRRHGFSTLLAFACSLVLPSLVGCSNHRFCTPKGTMNQQQATAIVHDPFPQGDIGPSDAASRPPSYQQPLPEAERVRLIPDAWPQLGR